MKQDVQPRNIGGGPAGRISRIYVAADCLDNRYTRKILERAGDIPVETISDQQILKADNDLFSRSLTTGKQRLLLCRNKGKFLRPCPGTREYICCGYQVLNIGMNCPMDCVYCILQAYLNNPWISCFVNVDDLLAELDEAFSRQPQRFWRIGTGEFTDSLAMDRLTGLSHVLVEFMAKKPQGVLELKTKTAEIHNLEDLDHNGRTIAAWSLNAPQITAREELHTASLEQRLAAAARCAAWGYRLAFHFDPIIYHPGWQEGYDRIISMLFDHVPAEKIAWISMGCLRFLPQLKAIAGHRFPKSVFFYEEFVDGLDGKQRYFRSQRIEMYRFLLERIRRLAPDVFVYLCMESGEIWREVFGFVPEERGGLAAMLDRAAQTAP